MIARSFAARLVDRQLQLPWLASGSLQYSVLVGLSLCVWLVKHRNQLPDPLLPQESTLLESYDAVAHQLWVMAFVAVSAALLVEIRDRDNISTVPKVFGLRGVGFCAAVPSPAAY